MRTVTIKESSRELTKREKLLFADGTDCIKLDGLSEEYADGNKELILNPVDYAILSIHNDEVKRDDQKKDYEALVILCDDGKRYSTGSQSFMNAFVNIYQTMEGEPFGIKILRKESNNFKGKFFLTCCIV